MATSPSFKEIKKPVNLLGLSFGLAGMLISLLTYYWSNKTKSISYLIDKPISLHQNKDSLYTATGYIWNSGDLPIAKEDLRSEITLVLVGANQIIDSRIMEQVKPGIAG